ncbi:MAG: hypothetical protein JXA21_06215 [Anaerolineae bacterium]|nr:hypothetical protein [Anaerolineae bacterium]
MKNNPYVGPRPYERRHSQNFYGRNREARDLLALILAERVVLFYAQSGAGKSSLLNAKVIPELEKENFLILPVARVGSSLPPGTADADVANIFMFSVLLSLAGGNVAPEQLRQHTLLSFLHEHYPQLASDQAGQTKQTDENPADFDEEGISIVVSPLLIVDQFEELFTTHRARWHEATNFFQQIREALEAIPRLGILFTMREDYVAELDPYAALLPRRLRARFRMDLLSLDGALEAIVKPAAGQGIHFGPPDAENDRPGAAEWLRDELRRVKVQRQVGMEMVEETILGPYIEPVQLQVVCNRLWENLPEQDDLAIDLNEVQQYGDVDRALVDFYESALTDAVQNAGTSERDLRHWFSNQLLTPMQTRGLALRGAVETAGMPNEAVDILQNRHIIRPEMRAGARWYELAHDRLVQPVLQSNQAWEAARQTPLRVAAQRWSEGKQAALLYRDEALKQALAWAAQHPDDVESYECEFLTASSNAEARRRWVRRAYFAAAVIAAITVTVVLTAAWYAVRSGLLAYSKEQAAESQYWRDFDQEVALDLAYEGIKQEQAPVELTLWRGLMGDLEFTEAEIALRQALVDFHPVEFYEDIPAEGLATVAGSEVSSLAYSPDGRYLYAGLSTGKLWVKDREKSEPVYIEAIGAARSLAVHPQQPLLAVAGDDGKTGIVRIFNMATQTWEQILQVPMPDGLYDEVYSLAFSSDGRYLAAGGDYGKKFRDMDNYENAGILRIWDLDSGQVMTLTQYSRRVTGVDFSADDRYMAVANYDQTFEIWGVQRTDAGALNFQHYLTPTAHTGQVFDVKFSPTDDTLLASSSADKTIRLWRLTPEDAAQPIKGLVTLIGHTRDVRTLVFSPDGDTLLSGSRDATALLWDVRALNPNPVLVFTGLTNVVQGIAFSPDGVSLAAGDGSGDVMVWDRDFLRKQRLSTLIGQDDRGRGVAYTPDGKYLISGDNTGVGLIWDVNTAQVVRELPAVGGKMWNLVVSHNGKYLVTCTDDNNAYVWDIQTGEQIARLVGHTDGVEHGAFSPDDRYLVTGADDQKVLVWDTRTWRETAKLTVPGLSLPGEVWGAIAYSPDGRWIAVGFTGGRLQLWSVDPTRDTFVAEPVVTLDHAHDNHIMSAAFSPDSRYLATGGWDNLARIWAVEATTLEPLENTRLDPDSLGYLGLEHSGYVYDVAFSPDGAYLATGSRDQMVRLWDMRSLPEIPDAPLAVFSGHTDLVWSLDFSPDGKYLASNSWDRYIRRYLVEFDDVYDLATELLEGE